MIEEMNNIPKEDDGSLAFLNIKRDENSRSMRLVRLGEVQRLTELVKNYN